MLMLRFSSPFNNFMPIAVYDFSQVFFLLPEQKWMINLKRMQEPCLKMRSSVALRYVVN